MNGSGLAAIVMAIGLAWSPALEALHRPQQNTAGKLEKHFASLVIVPGARDPQFRKYADGRQQVVYTIHADYPAKDVLAYISAKLHNTGWKPLRYDFLNPHMPSSLVRGWGQFDDTTQHPPVTVRQYMVDWRDRAHDVTRYGLEYRHPSDPKMLRVIAMYMPADVANKVKRADKAAFRQHPKN